ncbi:hypothetical protein NEMIN01_0594 [Nematocida minor]|uniref:uncharacterized protein n=1 Tax=Nematocida minor TaxID=1912983 RepID=UPI00222063CE|nr:uncharacterized protein NEMIN01_0594 [Nematocida minor]KAI5189641.1 hypothetical protein NEMIN01_0594 [Nematocida minor]
MDIVKIILKDSPGAGEIDGMISLLQTIEHSTIPYSLILDYLKVKSSELSIEKVRYNDKKLELSRILSEYIDYLTNVLELHKNKEIVFSEKVKALVEKAVNSQYITREDKLYLASEQKRVKESLMYQCSINSILIYISIYLVGHMEILKIEKNILELSQETCDEHAAGEKKRMSIYKVGNTPHPIRITGRTTQEDMKSMLTPTNGPSMSIEEYGERMVKMMEAQGISMDPPALGSAPEPDDSDLLNELNVQEIEELRKTQEKEEHIVRGDGNRIGRK